MQKILRHIYVLAKEIGPRGSATAEEGVAAAYVEDKLGQFGLESWQQSFQSITTFSWLYLIYFTIPIIATLLAPSLPWLALLISTFGALAFLMELNSWPVLSRLLPKRNSRNVIGRRPSVGEAQVKAKVVIMSHLDSSKAALNFKPGLVENFRTSFILMVSSVILPPFLLLLYALGNWTWVLGLVSLPFLYLLITVSFLVHRECWNCYTHGANDNASGVAVMLAVAEDAGQGLYPNLELWFVATGSEEAGTFGATAFLEKYGSELQDAYIINLDNVGAGALHFMAGEGMFPTHRASEELLNLARQAADQNLELEVAEGVYTLMSTDALPALVRGYKAMSLLATRDGLLPNWHWISDTCENVEEKTVVNCYRFVQEILKLLSIS